MLGGVRAVLGPVSTPHSARHTTPVCAHVTCLLINGFHTLQFRDKDSRTPWADAAAKAGELPAWKRMRPRGGKVPDRTPVSKREQHARFWQCIHAVGGSCPPAAACA